MSLWDRITGKTKANRADVGQSFAWPFADAESTAALTVGQIMSGTKEVLLVCHEAEEGDWHFLTNEPFEMSDGLFVTLSSMLVRDGSLAELADLPLGWEATRQKIGDPWTRRPSA